MILLLHLALKQVFSEKVIEEEILYITSTFLTFPI